MGRKVQHLGCGVTAGVLLGVLCYAAPQSSALSPDAAWFTDQAEAVGIDFVHVNGMSGELYISELMGPGAAMFDFDNDGDLDIYLVQGQMLGPGKTLDEAVLPRSARPLTDRLYRNDLDVHADGTRTLRFTDVSEASGLDVRSYGMGVAAGDIDNDGWVDLYRTSFGPNQLFRNNGDGTFTDVSDRTTGEPRWSVSASFVDIDRDGWLDLYVGNYLDHRLDLPQPECFIGTGERDYCGPKVYTPVPDQLYHNRGDGWVDIYVANDGEPNQLWINQQDGTFTNGALLAGVAFNADGLAVTHDPGSGEAHLRLADALRRTDRLEASLSSYQRVLELEPNWGVARFGEAMALVRLTRHPEAVERLRVAMDRHPEEPEFPHALARLLAATPDPQVRDGQAALDLVRALAEQHESPAVAETMAMASPSVVNSPRRPTGSAWR